MSARQAALPGVRLKQQLTPRAIVQRELVGFELRQRERDRRRAQLLVKRKRRKGNDETEVSQMRLY